MEPATGRVTATSVNLRKDPDGDLVEGQPVLVLSTSVEIKDDPGNGWLLVRGVDSAGQFAWGYVDAQFISRDPSPAGAPAPGPAASSLDPSITDALKVALQQNEIGDASPYQLSYARKDSSGASFGVFQGDTHSDPSALATLANVLKSCAVSDQVASNVLDLVSKPCPSGSPLTSDEEKIVNDALQSPLGQMLVDHMDDRIFQRIVAQLKQCIASAASARFVIETPAQLAISLWANMTGPPDQLAAWLVGTSALGVACPVGPTVSREDIDRYLQATKFFTENPQNFVHFSESVDAGVRKLAGPVASKQKSLWIYAQKTGNMFHIENGAPVLHGSGYSGNGADENNPDAQFVKMHGPLPRGFYTIGPPQKFKNMVNCLPLIPDPENDMGGRGGFLIHDGAFNHPHGNTSEGCICLPENRRLEIIKSGDHRLQVVADLPVSH